MIPTTLTPTIPSGSEVSPFLPMEGSKKAGHDQGGTQLRYLQGFLSKLTAECWIHAVDGGDDPTRLPSTRCEPKQAAGLKRCGLDFECTVLYITDWWFGTVFIIPYIGNSHPN